MTLGSPEKGAGLRGSDIGTPRIIIRASESLGFKWKERKRLQRDCETRMPDRDKYPTSLSTVPTLQRRITRFMVGTQKFSFPPVPVNPGAQVERILQ